MTESLAAWVMVSLFLLSHLTLAVWFASGIKSQVAQLAETVKAIATELEALAKLDGRIQVIESRMNRTEQDYAREG